MALSVNDDGRIGAPSGSSLPPALAQMIAQRLAAGTGGGTTSTGFLEISLNGKPGTEVHLRRSKRVIQSSNTQRFSSPEEAVNSWFLLDDKYRQDIQKKMWFLGLLDGPNNEKQALANWAGAVELAWNYKQAGKDVSPLDMLGRMTNLKAGQLANQPRTVTQRQVNFTDPAVAKAWLREAFQSSMGRDPHDAEIRAMLGAIASGNKHDPQVIQTTTDPEGNSTQKVLDAGFDPQAYIANQMAADPEARASQAAGTLYPALMAAIQSPV